MPRWLEYAFVFPAYRRKARRSLRWRLFGSHLLAVFMVPAVVLLLLAAVATVASEFTHGPETAATAARTVASSATAGSLVPGVGVSGARSVSLVGVDGRVRSSSIAWLVGHPASQIAPPAGRLAALALKGSTGLRANTSRYSGGVSGEVGAYPVRAANGDIIGAVVVDEPASIDAAPVLQRVVRAVGLASIFGAAVFLIPGLIIASFLGFQRARAVSRPVRALSDAAAALAAGDLSRRAEVSGDDEIGTLGRSFNAMASQLQETMAQQEADRLRAESALRANRELVANVSHELRTPVAVIRAHLEARVEKTVNAGEGADESYLTILSRETDRLENLVDDLFELSRLEATGVTVEDVPFDAGAAVREATDSLVEPARRDAAVAVRADVGAGSLACVGDPRRIVQVLQNLIRNAIRFTPEGGIVLVGASREGDSVALTVRDTGAGIRAEDLPYVFDRFYRADPSRNRSSGGAGLGLAIARDLVQAMHGTLAVESVEGEGSTFTIRLRGA